MRKVAVIIPAYSKDLKHYLMLNTTIISLLNSDNSTQFYITVIETEKNIEEKIKEWDIVSIQDSIYCFGKNHSYKIIKFPHDKFNYNQALNIGINDVLNSEFNPEIIIMCNNDLEFYIGCLKPLYKAFDTNPTLISASPFTDGWHCHEEFRSQKGIIYGMRRSWEFAGWCHAVKPIFFSYIPKFDERFQFHFSDDDLVMTMKQQDITHALIREFEILHHTSQSHELIPEHRKFEMLHDSNIFNQKWRKR